MCMQASLAHTLILADLVHTDITAGILPHQRRSLLQVGINTTKQYKVPFNNWTYIEIWIKEKEMRVFRRLVKQDTLKLSWKSTH